jgi:hypothetical protein
VDSFPWTFVRIAVSIAATRASAWGSRESPARGGGFLVIVIVLPVRIVGSPTVDRPRSLRIRPRLIPVANAGLHGEFAHAARSGTIEPAMETVHGVRSVGSPADPVPWVLAPREP